MPSDRERPGYGLATPVAIGSAFRQTRFPQSMIIATIFWHLVSQTVGDPFTDCKTVGERRYLRILFPVKGVKGSESETGHYRNLVTRLLRLANQLKRAFV